MNYKLLFIKITEIVNDVDPMGLIQGGAPLDEYSSEVAKILVELQKASSEDDLVCRLEKIFLSVINTNVYKSLATRIIPFKQSRGI